ncbi:MAG: peptide deformylase [Saprospiraceae bacterium]
MLEKIIKLGDPRLYQICEEVSQNEVTTLLPQIEALHQLILDFRKKYKAGRAIAAPQIGLMKRVICLNTPQKKQTIINPVLTNFSSEMIELWDDCMSFPNLHVRVKRHYSCSMNFYDENWKAHTWFLEDDLSELMQHEFDHLNGILATQRAIDNTSFKYVGV